MDLALLHFLLAIALFYWGFRLFSEGLQLSLGIFANRFLRWHKNATSFTFFKGFSIGLIVQCIHVAIRFIHGLSSARLIDFSKSIELLFGVLFAPLLLWAFLIYSPEYFKFLFIFFSLFSVLFFNLITRKNKNSFSWECSGEAFFGLGVMLFAQGFALDTWQGLVQNEVSLNRVIFDWLIPSLELKGLSFHIAEFLRFWLIFFVIGLIFRRSLVGFGLAWFLSTIGNWSTLATLSFVSATFMAVVVLEQGTFHKSGDGGKDFVRAFLFIGFLLIALDIVFFALSYFLIPQLFNIELSFIHNLLGSSSALIIYSFVRIFIGYILYLLVQSFNPKLLIKSIQHWAGTRYSSAPDRFLILGRPTDLVPSLALAQVRIQIEKLKVDIDLMMKTVREYIEQGPSAPVLANIKKLEDSTDLYYEDILEYVRGIQINPLTPYQSLEAQVLVSVTHELESITDYLDKMATYSTQSGGQNFPSEELKDEFWSLWNDVEDFYEMVTFGIVGELGEVESKQSELDELSKKIKKKTEALKTQALELTQNAQTENSQLKDSLLLSAQVYSDLVATMRKVRSHTNSIYYHLCSLHD